MRYAGRVARWGDDRGIGFIEPNGGGDALFMHVSDFERSRRRPRQGDVVTYAVADGRGRRPKAVDVCLREKHAVRARRESTKRASAGVVLAVASIGAMVFAAYTRRHRIVADSRSSVTVIGTSTRSFTCDGRTYCSQMASCEEATYFVQHCPDTTMDGDGIPCEQQLCQ